MNLQIQTIVIVALGILTLPLIFYAYGRIIARHQPRRNSTRYLREQIEDLETTVNKLHYKFTAEMPIDANGKLDDLKRRLNQLETKLDEQDEDSLPTKLQWLTERLTTLNSLISSQNVINKDFSEKIAALRQSTEIDYKRCNDLLKKQTEINKEMDTFRGVLATMRIELHAWRDQVKEETEKINARINEIA